MGSAAIMRFRSAEDKKVVLNLVLRHVSLIATVINKKKC
jgi:hypothetical protein